MLSDKEHHCARALKQFCEPEHLQNASKPSTTAKSGALTCFECKSEPLGDGSDCATAPWRFRALLILSLRAEREVKA